MIRKSRNKKSLKLEIKYYTIMQRKKTMVRKTRRKWKGPYYIQQELLNGSYKLKEINGKILKPPVNGELLKKYNSREEFVPYVVV